MSDDILEPGPQQRDRITVLAEAAPACRTRQFGVARVRLAAAIMQVGPRMSDSRKLLGERAP